MISESKVLRSTWFATLIILLTNWNFLSVKLLSSHNWMPHWSDTYLHSSCSTSSGVLAQLLLVLLSPNFWVGLKQDEFKIKIYIWIAPGIYEIWSSIPFQCIWLSISGSSIIPHLLHICISFLRLSSCKFMGLPYCICKLDPLYLYIYLSLHNWLAIWYCNRKFLFGLEKFGKGDWRSISRNVVVTRTPAQVASHAQKYFLRQNSVRKERKRSSIHDITIVDNNSVALPADQNWIPSPGAPFHQPSF